MLFEIIERRPLTFVAPQNKVILEWDDWNDYSYFTLFQIYYFDNNSQITNLGGVKIGFFGQKEYDRVLEIGVKFNELDKNFFSIGVDADYYVKLNSLGSEIRDTILKGLNDIAKSDEIFEKAIFENVVKVSFLRFISETSIKGQFKRLANGGVNLTKFSFEYIVPESEIFQSSFKMTFSVNPDLHPPSNIHVLIGRNGVGKTRLLHNIINIFTNPRSDKFGSFLIYEEGELALFANLMSVSFSAFDDLFFPDYIDDYREHIPYTYIGLREFNEEFKHVGNKNSDLLRHEFTSSFVNCIKNSKIALLEMVIKILESDPIFRDKNITNLTDEKLDVLQIRPSLDNIFATLSSGHKIILLTMTRIVENIQERSLILFDEPESHLHPPLLSSFIRALSELLTARNGVAIISTHSPVVLQEVPKSCIWNLRRIGNQTIPEKLQIESFGENVGILTQEVFGLEVTDSGFHKILRKTTDSCDNYEDAVNQLGNQIGLEAKAILRSMFYQKNK